MKSLRELNKEELLTFIYNHPLTSNINTFDCLAECIVCGTNSDAIYWYECEKCQKENEEYHKKMFGK